ncbi:hypothetical protein LEP1GSC124_2688 [Leptospira interrogans serovar Pyrogenes str. 200701872]|uniref:Uncharacterized protein n=1 Tax=Leptospira interrogans serovar Pyrogenes str. 200701872 TaxID=1193029 RepID=M6ZG40_LEPIR|nr:hypothetical protein LEP1GSC124_2688 [Leptospira interrogans serovar Pyrogenes str. 200701872]
MRQVLVKEASKENIQLRQSYKNLPHPSVRKPVGQNLAA